MKTLISASISLWTTCHSFGDNFDAVLNAALKEYNPNPETSLTRNGIDFGYSQQNIQEYGCWCYLDSDGHGQGRGPAKNEVDRLCKQLHDGWECTNMDNSTCEAHVVEHEVEYPPPLPNGWTEANMDDLTTKCEALNENGCTVTACMIDSYFMAELLKMFIANDFDPALLYGAGGPMDAVFRHDNGFDPVDGCRAGGAGGAQINGGTGGSHVPAPGTSNERQCCGEYPTRFAYQTAFGDRECCVNKTFDPAILSCCADGSLEIVCP